MIVDPSSQMYTVHSFVYFAMLVGLGFSTHTLLAHPNMPTGNWYQRTRSKIAAFAVVLFAWYFTYSFAIKHSPDAAARQTLENIISEWETGDKAKVLRALEELSLSERPWRRTSNWWGEY
jgi:hypothetical protein